MPKLGVINGQLTPCPQTPNCVSSQATDTAHFIAPIEFLGTAKEAQDRLVQLLKDWTRTKIILVEEDYIRVEFTSRIFRFVDDVEFYFGSAEAGQKVIQVRSASRIGRSDLGANRNRVEQIRTKFQTMD